MNRRQRALVRQQKTGFQLYQREHPDWSYHKQLTGFVGLTLGIMGLVLGGVWTASHPTQLLLPLAAIGGFILIKRFK